MAISDFTPDLGRQHRRTLVSPKHHHGGYIAGEVRRNPLPAWPYTPETCQAGDIHLYRGGELLPCNGCGGNGTPGG
ncbi:hypothetical protein AB0I30_03105 [Nocardia tengchongensis]|uniref:hypothetical protein n=1 Tax=Nocardia tengchongensis TaxID=2055889 RepID=UPI00340B0C34